jgi:hypothetical protein
VVLKKTKKLRTQINGKFVDVSSANIKRQNIYSLIADFEVILVFEYNNTG